MSWAAVGGAAIGAVGSYVAADTQADAAGRAISTSGRSASNAVNELNIATQRGIDDLNRGRARAARYIADATGEQIDTITSTLDDSIAQLARTQDLSTDFITSSTRDAISTLRSQGGGESFQPYIQTGEDALGRANNLISDPNAQRDYITNNPFYDALAGDAQRRVFSNQAAKGKLGSGETATDLQNELLVMGTNLLNNQIGNEITLANMGQNASGSYEGLQANQASNIANMQAGEGQALANINQATGGAQTDLINQAGTNIANIQGQSGLNLANLSQTTANNVASLLQSRGANIASAYTGAGTNIANLQTQQGNAQAAGIMGVGNAITSGIQNWQDRQAANPSTDSLMIPEQDLYRAPFQG